MTEGLRLLLLGATGLVGRAVLESALADARIASVVAPCRTPIVSHPKLQAPQVDFAALPAAAWWQADAAICTFGASLLAAESREAFRAVDHGYVLAAARLIRAAGTPGFVLLSALGANPSSRLFYTRVKGELERDLGRLGFPSLTLVRPAMIGGRRDPSRLLEDAASVFFTVLAPVLPGNWRMVQARTVASGLIEHAVACHPGQMIIGARELSRSPA